MKYRSEIENDNIDRFYEVLFHALNLNNLAVDGNLFTAKFKEIWNNPRVNTIKEDLKQIYEIPQETAEVFKNANFIFLSLLIDYMKIQMDILDSVKLFYMNQTIHREKDIFILTNRDGASTYKIWKLSEDPKQNFGYSFSKIRTIELPNIEANTLNVELQKIDDPKLAGISGRKNLCFAVIEEKEDDNKVAKAVKDLILLNKGISKTTSFEPMMVPELYEHVWIEKIMPFTLSQWADIKG